MAKYSDLEKKLLEELAELEHDQWIAWSKNIAETEQNISPERLVRWEKLWKPYAQLTEEEKELDRFWARKQLPFFPSLLHAYERETEVEKIEHEHIKMCSVDAYTCEALQEEAKIFNAALEAIEKKRKAFWE